MTDVAGRTTAMLIIRVWREDGSFRATVSASPDVVTTEPTEQGSAAAREEVLEIVDQWLRSV